MRDEALGHDRARRLSVGRRRARLRCAWRLAGAACAQECEDSDDAAMVCRHLADIELAEDASDVSLERLRTEEQSLGDSAVGVSLCHERKHLALPRGELREWPGVAAVADETGDDRGIDHTLS